MIRSLNYYDDFKKICLFDFNDYGVLDNIKTFQIIGNRYSGKTTLVNNIVKILNYSIQFKDIYLFTQHNHYNNYDYFFERCNNYFNSLNLNYIFENENTHEYVKKRMDDIIQKQKEDPSKPILIICDEHEIDLFPMELLESYLSIPEINIYAINVSQKPALSSKFTYDMIFAYKENIENNKHLLCKMFKPYNLEEIFCNLISELVLYTCVLKINKLRQLRSHNKIYTTRVYDVMCEKKLLLSQV